ncbi:hypothetical protein Scep_003749 [Stephania cephalantha]|uniref:Uncharacterized protein n=1 Tax=Stephania cephalantha TaxID=152367 RepID=A0AAP0KS12_9MAGN
MRSAVFVAIAAAVGNFLQGWDNATIAGPPNSQFIKSVDKNSWDAKDVADCVLSDKSALMEAEFAHAGTTNVLKKILTYLNSGPLMIPKHERFATDTQIALPDWLTEAYIKYYVSKYQHKGFTGDLNYYGESCRRRPVRGEGGSDPWRETPRREEEGGDCNSFFDRGRCIRGGDGGEEMRRAHRSKRSGFQEENGQRYVEAFAWQWYVEEEQRPSRQRRRDLRRRQRREEARRQRQRIRQWSGRRR